RDTSPAFLNQKANTTSLAEAIERQATEMQVTRRCRPGSKARDERDSPMLSWIKKRDERDSPMLSWVKIACRGAGLPGSEPAGAAAPVVEQAIWRCAWVVCPPAEPNAV